MLHKINFRFGIRYSSLLLLIAALTWDIFRGSINSFGPEQIIISLVAIIFFLASYIDKTDLQNNIKNKKNNSIIDIIIILFFSIFAYIYIFGRWHGVLPYINLFGDSAKLASMATALDHPLNFTKDYIFHDAIYLKSYITFQIPIIRGLSLLTKDYAFSTLVILFFSILVQLSGFYFLGKYLFKDRTKGFIVAILTSILINYNPWDYWGIFSDAQPRFLFQAFLPFLLIAGYHYKDRPSRWPFVLLFTGFLFYFHTISGVGIAFMLLFGYLLRRGNNTHTPQKFLYLTISTLVFVVIISPFIIIYKRNFIQPMPVDYDTAIYFLQTNFDMLLNVALIVNYLIGQLWIKGIIFYILLCIPFILLFRISFNDHYLLLFWSGGLIVFSILLPWLEHFFEIHLRILPYQMDFTRNIRYLIPLLLILICISIEKITILLPTHHKLIFNYLVIILFFAMTLYSPYDAHGTDLIIKSGITCIMSPSTGCLPPKYKEQIEVLNYLNNETGIQESNLVLSVDFPIDAIRYYSTRSIAFYHQETIAAVAYLDLPMAIENHSYYVKYLKKTLREGSLLSKEKVYPFCRFTPDYIIADNSERNVIDIDIPISFSNRDYIVYQVSNYCSSTFSK